MVMQALIYDRDWWGITWSTRALLPALPLLMLTSLPALDASLQGERQPIRILTWLLLAASLLIQIGRIWTSDPAYANWAVQTTGENLNAAQQWDLRLMPLWRHWHLALQGIESDIAWLQLWGAGKTFLLLLLLTIALVIAASVYLLFKKKPVRPQFTLIILLFTLGLLPASLAVARFDQRYRGENENYRAACEWLAANTNDDSLLLVDAYLKPLWWYTFNFGCGERAWLGLPYEHIKPLSGALYYPRLLELSVWLKEQQAQGVEVYLLEENPTTSLAYHKELERYYLILVSQKYFSQTTLSDLNIYQSK
jgi:hypothetical protein